MWSPWKVALFLLSLPSYESSAYFLDSNDYYLIQNAFREHFVPTLWCGVRNAAPYSNPGAVSVFYPHLDTCCKMHDQCPIFVPRCVEVQIFVLSYGLVKPAEFWRFFQCLLLLHQNFRFQFKKHFRESAYEAPDDFTNFSMKKICHLFLLLSIF